MTPPPPPAALRARILADVAKTPATKPGAFRARSLAAAAALALWCAAALLVLGLRRDWAELPAPYASGTLALLAVGAASLTWVAAARGRAMVGPPAAVALVALAALPPALSLVSMALVSPAASSASVAGWGELVRNSLICDGLSMALALPLLGLLLLLKRGMLVPAPALVGAALGTAAATWAHALVHMHCALADRWHILIGHALPTLPLMAVGALLGLLCFRGRPRPR
ncbi:MAG TPA: NrsF family protein [Polyangiaceae bacterium]|nr:NrsF family protein [Polyangiaceae bacterium]